MRNTEDRINQVQCFVLDMDGTFYLGERLIPGSLEFIESLKEQGKEFLFLTNNSSRDASYYVKKLERMGCFVDESKVYTSGQATAQYLNRIHKGKRIYLLGNEYLKKEFMDFGIHPVEDEAEIVVVGFDTSLTYEKLTKACHFIRQGIPYIATHPDLNCPTEDGFIPDCGAILAFIKASTDREPEVIVGKPNEEIVRGILERTGLPKEKLAMVGDRLYTDIATGIHHGLLSLLVLSGETRWSDLSASFVKPDRVFQNLKDIADHLALSGK